MKIAFPVYLHGFGGAEKQVITLANQMIERGHEVHIILLSDNNIKYHLSVNATIHSLLNAEKCNKISTILNRRKLLIKKLQEIAPDVVVNFNFQSAYLLSLKRKDGIGKIVYSERSDPGDKEYSGIMGLIRKFVLHKIDAYVFQSEGARDYFKDEYIQSHCEVIPNACFIDKTNPSNNRLKRIVNVGRLSLQKNQKLLIDAFSFLSSKYSDFVLEIYGDGELKTDLETYTKSLKLSDRIHFKGTSKNISKEIQDATLFILSSDYEGIPNALIEAMAVGLPCISTDCRPGGARTLIENGKNGIITPIGDTESLAKAMDYLLSNPEIAEEMGKNAINIVDRLSPKKIYDAWEDFLEKSIR